MYDTELYSTILGIESPWTVSAVKFDEVAKTITVRVELPQGTRLPCPSCGQTDCAIKDRRDRQWRHLDTCQFQTLITAPLPRVTCSDCGVKTVNPPWAEKHGRFTRLFECFAISALQEMSMVGVCRLLHVSWDEAAGIMERAVQRGLKLRDLGELRRLGIDEKAVQKGHKYITVVYNLETSKVVWMGRDRKEATLDKFFASLTQKVRDQIECITMDMWKPYRASCRKWIADADAKIVLDRFHIDQHLNQAVDQVRKEEHRALHADGIELLAKTKWDWLYRPERLPPERERRFHEVRQYALKTVRAHEMKETFRHFWNYSYLANARRFFKSWYYWATHSRLVPMIKVAKRIHKHLPNIETYFRFRVTNSTAEGINNKIQTIKKKAYGFRNIERFINSIYFHCGGLKLDPL